MKNNKCNIGSIITSTIILAIVIYFTIGILLTKEACWNSKYNTFTNESYNPLHVSRMWNKCYIMSVHYDSYETKKECGTFGISCYEASEPHTEHFTTTSVDCFNLKTGERC